jgi:molybdate transport system regulatory protein
MTRTAPRPRIGSADAAKPGPGDHRAVPPQVRILLNNVIAIGPGKATLLEAIAAGGSISAAARSMGMSYRRAWDLVATMNQSFVEPVVDTATGGARGGGARLTPFGHEVLRRYRAMEDKARRSIAREVAAFGGLLRGRGR